MSIINEISMHNEVCIQKIYDVISIWLVFVLLVNFEK